HVRRYRNRAPAGDRPRTHGHQRVLTVELQTDRLLLRVAVAVAAMLLPAVALAGYTLAPEPTWIRVDQAPDPGSVPAGADATRYLLVVDQVNLTGPRPAWYRRVGY